MARQTIRTTSLFARGADSESPTEVTREVDVGDEHADEEPTIVVEDQSEHAEATGASNNGASNNGASSPSAVPPRRGRRAAAAAEGQQPQNGPASPTSSAAKGRAKRTKPAVVEITSDDREAVGNLAVEAMLRGVDLSELVAEYRAAVNAFDRVVAAMGNRS